MGGKGEWWQTARGRYHQRRLAKFVSTIGHVISPSGKSRGMVQVPSDERRCSVVERPIAASSSFVRRGSIRELRNPDRHFHSRPGNQPSFSRLADLPIPVKTPISPPFPVGWVHRGSEPAPIDFRSSPTARRTIGTQRGNPQLSRGARIRSSMLRRHPMLP